MRNYDEYAYITSNTTTQVKNGPGTLKRLVINTPVASSTISLIDGRSGTTANIGIITNTTDVKPYVLEFNLRFAQGLRIVTSGDDDITVVFE